MNPLACGIRANYWSIFAICEHIGAKDTAYIGRCKCIGVDEATNFGVIIAGLQIVQASLSVVIIALVAEGVLSAYRVCGAILKLYKLAPCIVGVGYDELAGGSIGEGYYIALEIVDVIVEIILSIRHGDTVALLVVEEAQCLAVGRLGEYLRSVEQVLGRSRAHETGRNLVCRLLLEKKKRGLLELQYRG